MGNWEWQRSSYCEGEGGHCIEVHATPTVTVLRLSQLPDDILAIKPQEWAAFVAGIKAGEFDHLIP